MEILNEIKNELEGEIKNAANRIVRGTLAADHLVKLIEANQRMLTAIAVLEDMIEREQSTELRVIEFCREQAILHTLELDCPLHAQAWARLMKRLMTPNSVSGAQARLLYG